MSPQLHSSTTRNQRRDGAALAHRDDPAKFVQAVANQGYATDPHYAEKLKSIIRLHIAPLVGQLPEATPSAAAGAMKRLCSLLLLVLWCASACARAAGLVKNEDEAIRLVVDAVHRFELTTLSDECWLMGVTERPSRFEFAIKERHTPACGGDPKSEHQAAALHGAGQEARRPADQRRL